MKSNFVSLVGLAVLGLNSYVTKPGVAYFSAAGCYHQEATKKYRYSTPSFLVQWNTQVIRTQQVQESSHSNEDHNVCSFKIIVT